MNFCSECGSSVSLKIPSGEDRQRHVCDSCGTIHYRNPNIIAGTIPRWEDAILLCRRGIAPKLGLWTVPAGFLELGESVEDGAKRETREETRAEVRMGSIHGIYSIPRIGQVYMIYQADLLSTDYGPTPESTEVRLFREEEIPWDEIAFKVVEQALRDYFANLKQPRALPFTEFRDPLA